MKNCIRKAVWSAVALSGLMPVVSYAGLHYDGYVNIRSNSSIGWSYMDAAFNVRHNPSLQSSYVGFTVGVNGVNAPPIAFWGADDNGNSFYCEVEPSHWLYPAAVNITNSFKDGSAIHAARLTDSTQCAYVWHEMASYMLD